ncbi:hypothetical protein ACTFIU_005816 [Dictyostelium citrinum]
MDSFVDTESEISQDSSERNKELTFFVKLRLDNKNIKRNKKIISNIRENDYPDGQPTSLEKYIGLIRTPHIEESQPISLVKQNGLFRNPDEVSPISLEKQSDIRKTPSLPPQIKLNEIEPPIKSFKISSPPKSQKNLKISDISNINNSKNEIILQVKMTSLTFK